MKLPDLWIFIPAVLLTSIGLLISSTVSPAEFDFQWKVALASILIAIFIFLIDSEFLYILAKPVYLLTILLLILLLIFNDPIRGSRRWFAFGPFVLQISEFAKLSLILFFAGLSQHTKLTEITKYIWALLIIAIPVFLVFIQPDLGSSIILGLIGILSVIILRPKKRYILATIIFTAILVPLSLSFLAPYQKARLDHFINPGDDPLGASYNQIQAVIAVGSGQLIGLGLGKGSQSRLHFLPEKQTDFFFATASEQLGFISSTLIVLLYSCIALRSLYVISKIKDRRASIILLGSVGLIFIQAVIHIGINVGIMPVTGIPLPFMSVGGSSMLVSWLCIGMMLCVEKDNRQLKAFEIL